MTSFFMGLGISALILIVVFVLFPAFKRAQQIVRAPAPTRQQLRAQARIQASAAFRMLPQKLRASFTSKRKRDVKRAFARSAFYRLRDNLLAERGL